jgi:ATP-dependent helicase Lhr and Lhr-like helicase
MVAFVSASVDRPPTIPSWHSEMLPLSYDTAIEIGRLRKKLRDMYESQAPESHILPWIMEYAYCEENTARAIHNYMREQHDFMQIPHHEHIIVERYKEEGYTYLLFNSIYGRRVNDVLSRALAFIAAKLHGRDVQIGITDSGFFLMTSQQFNTQKVVSYLKEEKLDLLMDHAINSSEVLSRRFRHCAARSMMILRNYKGRTKTAGRQQVSSMKLLKTVRDISEDFPILREARREVLEDMMDINNAKKVIRGIESGKIIVEEKYIGIPSPFSFNILTHGRSDLIKIEDRFAFIQRMHNQVLAKIEIDRARNKKS